MGFTFSLPYFLLIYAALSICVVWQRKIDLRGHPEKRERYQALPLRYKLMCWFVVTPLAACTPFYEACAGIALVLMFLLEAACVRWYRKAGLY